MSLINESWYIKWYIKYVSEFKKEFFLSMKDFSEDSITLMFIPKLDALERIVKRKMFFRRLLNVVGPFKNNS